MTLEEAVLDSLCVGAVHARTWRAILPDLREQVDTPFCEADVITMLQHLVRQNKVIRGPLGHYLYEDPELPYLRRGRKNRGLHRRT